MVITEKRPYSQIETPSMREPPPASKADISWEAGLKQWKNLKRLRAQATMGRVGMQLEGMDSTRLASSGSVGEISASGVAATLPGATSAAKPFAKQDYRAKLDKYQNVLKSTRDHKRLMDELRQIEDQTVAQTVEESDED
eukprot:NODE_4821_length_756_cov_26.991513_g4469_i0.p1 GENE.NODE_4821_length_756_cov_26.991513_g4469_i0~~NODE_4821_length_756_cov_26.991513_g4469_i0.p1  ORF type:complete len:140 (+),score=27.10 NODE_4821_length_756_cov_26.991513_g4469_i0:130-549(+)